MEPEGSLPCSQKRTQGPMYFYGEELLAIHQNLKLDDHPLSDVRDCLFSIFAAIFRIEKPSPLSSTRGRALPW